MPLTRRPERASLAAYESVGSPDTRDPAAGPVLFRPGPCLEAEWRSSAVLAQRTGAVCHRQPPWAFDGPTTTRPDVTSWLFLVGILPDGEGSRDPPHPRSGVAEGIDPESSRRRLVSGRRACVDVRPRRGEFLFEWHQIRPATWCGLTVVTQDAAYLLGPPGEAVYVLTPSTQHPPAAVPPNIEALG